MSIAALSRANSLYSNEGGMMRGRSVHRGKGPFTDFVRNTWRSVSPHLRKAAANAIERYTDPAIELLSRGARSLSSRAQSRLREGTGRRRSRSHSKGYGRHRSRSRGGHYNLAGPRGYGRKRSSSHKKRHYRRY